MTENYAVVCCPIQESGSAAEECSQWSKGQEIKQVCVVSIYIHCHAVCIFIIQVNFVCRHHWKN